MNKDSLIKLKKYDFFQEKAVPTELVLENVKHKWGEYMEVPHDISIVIITYKRLDLLKETIQSVLTQAGNVEYQLIIIDNAGISEGVTDVEEYINTLGDRHIIYFQQDEEKALELRKYSLYDAGVVLAKTEWVTVVHDDDILHPLFLDSVSGILGSHNEIDALTVDLFPFNDFEKVDFDSSKGKKSTKLSRYTEAELMDYETKSFLGTVVKRSIYLKIGFFCNYDNIQSLSEIDDYVFLLRLSHKYQTYYYDRKLYGYRSWEGASSNKAEWDNVIVCTHYLKTSIANEAKGLLKWIIKENARFFTVLEVDNLTDENKNHFNKCMVVSKDKVYEDCGFNPENYRWKWGIKLIFIRFVIKMVKLIKK